MAVNYQKTKFYIIEAGFVKQVHKADPEKNTNDVFRQDFTVMYQDKGANKVASMRFIGNEPDKLHFSTRYGPDVFMKYGNGKMWVSGGLNDEDVPLATRCKNFDISGLEVLDLTRFNFEY